MKDKVVLCECFARDGLQHEPAIVSTARKIALVNDFSALGFQRIEATSFTHPGNVPQFFDADELLKSIKRRPGTRYKATCVNLRSVQRAVAAADQGFGPDEISVILSASEGMLKRAFNRDPQDEFDVVGAMIEAAGGRFTVIGTISFVFGSPFDGAVDVKHVIDRARWLRDRGVKYIAIGDTMGLGNPRSIGDLFARLRQALPDADFIAHFHDTRGVGIANCAAAYEAGARYFDCAFGGAGGNPAKIAYAGGHTGNVCTEDLAAMFESMGVDTGLDMSRLIEVAHGCEQAVGRELYGRVARSGLGLLGERQAA